MKKYAILVYIGIAMRVLRRAVPDAPAGERRRRIICRQREKVIQMAKDINLQDVFLNQARKYRIPVTIYITNGFQFKGVVKGFDNYTVILDTDGKQNLIYKHAISTITPLKPISILDAYEKAEEE